MGMAAPRDDTAQQLARGVGRLLTHLGYHSLTEFTLRSGRRAGSDDARAAAVGERLRPRRLCQHHIRQYTARFASTAST